MWPLLSPVAPCNMGKGLPGCLGARADPTLPRVPQMECPGVTNPQGSGLQCWLNHQDQGHTGMQKDWEVLEFPKTKKMTHQTHSRVLRWANAMRIQTHCRAAEMGFQPEFPLDNKI